MDVQQLARSDAFILRARDYSDPSASTAFGKFEKRGVLLRVAKGAYVLVPEAMREPETNWRPPIESVALGLASVEHGPSQVALIGPSAARTHGCLPRPLGVATVSYPSTRTRTVKTLVGAVRLYARSIDRMDVVRVSTDLVVGLATSIEMTMLDLLSGGPNKWPIETADRAEAIRLLAGQADWALMDQIAQQYRKRTALKTSLSSESHVIPASEIRTAAAALLVPEFQIVRDHVVSHIIHALQTFSGKEDVVFFGGTALCRTWCPNLRLSEDIDLIVSEYPDASETILNHIKTAKRSEFPDLAWGPFDANNDTQTTIVTTGSSTIKLQFVKPRPRENAIPITCTDVALRYSDLPPSAELNVPTAQGFAAMKLMAWHQRQACRDLYDLAALAEIGAICDESVELTHQVTNSRIGYNALNHRLTPRVLDNWDGQLTHQLHAPLSAATCLQAVLDALRSLEDE